MTNKEKFLALVSKEETNSLERNRERIKNRALLRESQKIAVKVLHKLDELGWKQKDLAREMGVTPQQITKIVRGKENLGLATQIKLQTILDIPILASYYDDKMKELEDVITDLVERINYRITQPLPIEGQPEINYNTDTTTLNVVYSSLDNKVA